MSQNKTQKKLFRSVAAVIILAVCLCATSFALVYKTVTVEDNYFRTGRVSINLNDGQPVIKADEYIFEPGMTVHKTFFIENGSTWDVYYKLYFSEVSGGLADVLEITIKDGDAVLCQGTASALTRQNTSAQGTLSVGQRKELDIYFHFPEGAGNSAQGESLSFDLCADGVQTKNNPDGQFD